MVNTIFLGGFDKRSKAVEKIDVRAKNLRESEIFAETKHLLMIVWY